MQSSQNLTGVQAITAQLGAKRVAADAQQRGAADGVWRGVPKGRALLAHAPRIERDFLPVVEADTPHGP